MFWRKFKLDWTYALGELFIVTAGVLIALALDGWNSARLERAHERDLVARLMADIDGDLRRYDYQIKAIDRKEESLLRVRATFATNGPIDAAGFLRDIVDGANFGWSQVTAQRATFDDLLQSGRLALIEDADVRALIAAYYAASTQAIIRIDERETAYPDLSYQLVPRGPTVKSAGGLGEGSVEPGLRDDALNQLVKSVRQSRIEDHVIAEVNLARFIRGVTANLRQQGSELLTRLKDYQKRIE